MRKGEEGSRGRKEEKEKGKEKEREEYITKVLYPSCSTGCRDASDIPRGFSSTRYLAEDCRRSAGFALHGARRKANFVEE